MQSYPVVLSIAGSDSSGGAGIQADIKTLSMLSCYAATAITTVTAQNTQQVTCVEALSVDVVRAQCIAVLEDVNVSAIKIGMLFNESIIAAVADILAGYADIPVIVDPVMVSQQGAHLLESQAIRALENDIFSKALLITPNLHEAALLHGAPIETEGDMAAVAQSLSARFNTGVLLKGGHADSVVVKDVYVQAGEVHWFESPRIDTPHTHGTGCTLSAAIAGFIAQGLTMLDTIAQARTFVLKAIQAGQYLSVGQGSGPVDHGWLLRSL